MATLIIILLTAAVSILCFQGMLDMDALKFNAYDVWHRKQWYRMLSYGLVHGSWGHLFFNMLTLYFFGTVVERYFQAAEYGQHRTYSPLLGSAVRAGFPAGLPSRHLRTFPQSAWALSGRFFAKRQVKCGL